MSNDQSDKTMLQSITQLINSIGNQGISCDVIVQIFVNAGLNLTETPVGN